MLYLPKSKPNSQIFRKITETHYGLSRKNQNPNRRILGKKKKVNRYLLNWGCGDERRSFGSETRASLGVVVVAKIVIHDECNLERDHFSLSKTLSFFSSRSISHIFKKNKKQVGFLKWPIITLMFFFFFLNYFFHIFLICF